MTVKYTADHEWISFDEAGPATVGITDHAQDALGDVVFVELPEVGRQFAQNDVAGVVESVKAVADLYIAGQRRGRRGQRGGRGGPEAVNNDPYERGLVLQGASLANPSEIDALMTAGALRRPHRGRP